MRDDQPRPVWMSPPITFWTLEWVVRDYAGIHRAQKAIQVDGCQSRRMSLHRFPLALSYLEPLRVTGPLQSLVLQTEDMWRRHNH